MHAARQRGGQSLSGPSGRILLAYHVRWAGIGYVVGLLGVVPLVLWLTALAPEAQRRHGVRAGESDVPELIRGPRPATRRIEPPLPVADGRAESLESVRNLMAAHAIERARALVQPLADTGDGEALFLLAETYDPLRLAGLGVVDARSDVERARHLYEGALAAGYAAARDRLDQLR